MDWGHSSSGRAPATKCKVLKSNSLPPLLQIIKKTKGLNNDHMYQDLYHKIGTSRKMYELLGRQEIKRISVFEGGGRSVVVGVRETPTISTNKPGKLGGICL
jgi:hypothetical protein